MYKVAHLLWQQDQLALEHALVPAGAAPLEHALVPEAAPLLLPNNPSADVFTPVLYGGSSIEKGLLIQVHINASMYKYIYISFTCCYF